MAPTVSHTPTEAMRSIGIRSESFRTSREQFPWIGQGFDRAHPKIGLGLTGRAIAIPRLLAAAIGELLVLGDGPTQKALRHDETGKRPRRIRAATKTNDVNVRPGFVIAGNERIPAYHTGDDSRSEHPAHDPFDRVARIADAVNIFGNLHHAVGAQLLFLLAFQFHRAGWVVSFKRQEQLIYVCVIGRAIRVLVLVRTIPRSI